jgi:hypothetical protein
MARTEKHRVLHAEKSQLKRSYWLAFATRQSNGNTTQEMIDRNCTKAELQTQPRSRQQFSKSSEVCQGSAQLLLNKLVDDREHESLGAIA